MAMLAKSVMAIANGAQLCGENIGDAGAGVAHVAAIMQRRKPMVTARRNGAIVIISVMAMAAMAQSISAAWLAA
jgi:hypothetical protein